MPSRPVRKSIASIALLVASISATAAGYSGWAIPTAVELASGGVLIHGAFGDPNACGEAGYIFVSQQSSTYESVLTIALSALHGKKEMKLYSDSCATVSAHWAGDVISENRDGKPVYIR